MTHMIQNEIFKAYDIRGIYPTELNEEIIYKIGQAYAHILKPKKIVIAEDARPHSPKLRAALTKALTDAGASVISIGLATTPMFYFAIPYLNADAGMIITASHNPAQYNGIKMVKDDAKPFGDDEIQEIKKLVEKNIAVKSVRQGTLTEKNILQDYIKKALSFANIKQKLKVVIDCGNGMCGLIESQTIDKLPIEAVYLYKNVDLTFPNHEANPLKTETLKDLQNEVTKQQADIGISFDGDGDRVGFVDEKGNIVSMDIAGALIATQILKRAPNSTVLYDVRSSKAVPEAISENSGKPEKIRVGHFFIKKRMREINAAFALELSGHYYFKELAFAESAIVAAILILNTISASDKPFSEIIKPFRRYSHTGEINFEVRDKDEKIKQISQHYNHLKQEQIDGITVEHKDWWFNLRKSNTEPLLRLNLEANTRELMEKKLKEVEELILNRLNY